MNGTLSRINISIFGLFLGAISLWIVVPELFSPNITTLPASPEEAAAAASRRGEALWAARAALVRGDLWAEFGLYLRQFGVGGFDAGRRAIP